MVRDFLLSKLVLATRTSQLKIQPLCDLCDVLPFKCCVGQLDNVGQHHLQRVLARVPTQLSFLVSKLSQMRPKTAKSKRRRCLKSVGSAVTSWQSSVHTWSGAPASAMSMSNPMDVSIKLQPFHPRMCTTTQTNRDLGILMTTAVRVLVERELGGNDLCR